MPPGSSRRPAITGTKATMRGPNRCTSRPLISERRSWEKTTAIIITASAISPSCYDQGDYGAGHTAFGSGRSRSGRNASGENHWEYAVGLNALARLYQAQGDYARAEPLYRQALEIRKKSFGESHPLVPLAWTICAAVRAAR